MSHPIHMPRPPVTAGDRAALRYLVDLLPEPADKDDPRRAQDLSLAWLDRRFPTL